MKQRVTLYLCDPEKNAGCSKTGCVHNPDAAYPTCRATKYAEFAKLDEQGQPIKLPDWRKQFIEEARKHEAL